MWENRKFYNGLSVLPYEGGTYTQAPFQDITEAQYHEMMKSLTDIDLSKVIESEDNTNLTGELACAGSSCEIDVVLKKSDSNKEKIEVSEAQI